jgi:outer membrane protein assembly factor BamE (lipoprotein component of BamABCDE complex)
MFAAQSVASASVSRHLPVFGISALGRTSLARDGRTISLARERFCCIPAQFVQNVETSPYMKSKFLVAALLLSSCLTVLASYPRTITQENVNQIRPGQTTEADLVNLFGIPTTRFVDLEHYTAIDWFRSVPAPAQSYIPVIGYCLGGLNVEAQQLTVILSPGGRVVRYEVHSSLNRLHAASGVATGYSK